MPAHRAEPIPVGHGVPKDILGSKYRPSFPQTLGELRQQLPGNAGSTIARAQQREAQPPSGSDLAQRFLNGVGGWNDRAPGAPVQLRNKAGVNGSWGQPEHSRVIPFQGARHSPGSSLLYFSKQDQQEPAELASQSGAWSFGSCANPSSPT